MEGDTPKEPGELKDNVFDLATTRRRRDPVTRELLEAIEKMNEDLRLMLLNYVQEYLIWFGNRHPKRVKRFAAGLRKRRQAATAEE